MDDLPGAVEHPLEHQRAGERDRQARPRPEAGCGKQRRGDAGDLEHDREVVRGHLGEQLHERDGLEQGRRLVGDECEVARRQPQRQQRAEPDAKRRKPARVLGREDEALKPPHRRPRAGR